MIFHLTTNKKMRKNHIRIFNQNKIKTIAKTAFNAKVLKLNNLYIQNDLCSGQHGVTIDLQSVCGTVRQYLHSPCYCLTQGELFEKRTIISATKGKPLTLSGKKDTLAKN